MKRPLPFPARFVAAHRGSVSAAAPENTLDAFNAAIAASADAIELDVRLTAGLLTGDDEVFAAAAARAAAIDADFFAPHESTIDLDAVDGGPHRRSAPRRVDGQRSAAAACAARPPRDRGRHHRYRRVGARRAFSA
jgi:hypothetical protein